MFWLRSGKEPFPACRDTNTLPVAEFTTAVCTAVNVSSKPREISIGLMDDAGVAVEGPGAFTVAPGATAFVTETNSLDSGVVPLWRCEFDVKGGKNSIRAGMSLFDPDSGNLKGSDPAR